MGRGPLETFRTVVLPQLWPAIAVGGLLVALYVISDFGAVSIMRFDSFTREIYISYKSSFDRTATAGARDGARAADARPALGQRAAAARRAPLHRLGPGAGAPAAPVRARALALAGARRSARRSSLIALVLPGRRARLLGDEGARLGRHLARPRRRRSPANSLMTGVGAALAGGLAALVVARARRAATRARSRRAIERVGHAGYALPGIVVALALVFFATRARAGALPDPRDAGLRAHRPLPAARDRPDRRLAAPGLAAGRGGRARARARARARSSARSPRRSCAAASSPASRSSSCTRSRSSRLR